MTEEEFKTGVLADGTRLGQPNPHGINACYQDVHQFHRVFGHPLNHIPTIQPNDRKQARADWLDEEVRELREAVDVVDQADAYLDIIYFAVGGLVEIGVDPNKLWQIVHNANMSKVQPDGSVKRREDGKIVKPEGWVAPEPLMRAEIHSRIVGTAGELSDEAKERLGR